MQEKRRHGRNNGALQMSINLPNGQIRTLIARDVSDGGIFLLARPEEKLPIGTEVAMSPAHIDATARPPSILGRVVRASAQGMGIEFIEPSFS